MNKQIAAQLVDDGPLYVSEKKIYPREIKGRYQRFQRLALLVLLGLYYGVAWLNWDGRQAVLWDLPARKFYIFNLVFWPQDFIFLALLLIMAGLSLFFFTALAGRLWCGYACPQTVWTEAFLWVEQKLEGDRNQRMKLDASPWNGNKILRKFGKHSLWLILALVDRFYLRRLFHTDQGIGRSLPAIQLERLGNFLGAVLFFRDLGQCRLHARTGVQIHVPLCPFPERDV